MEKVISQNVLFLIENALKIICGSGPQNSVLGSAQDKCVQVNCKLIYTL